MSLGAGLDALFEDNAIDSRDAQTLRMSEIEPNKSQPRKVFDEGALRELAESIREHGLIQPIVVRPMPNGMTYQIVAGERRWRACRILGLDEVPVIIKELDDFEMAQLAIIENVQRADLNPMEEAAAYKELVDTYKMNHETVAKVIGKSRSYITNALRLMSMPEQVQDYVREGKLSMGHAKAVMGLDSNEQIMQAAEQIVTDNMNVRQTEKMVSKMKQDSSDEKPVSNAKQTQFNFYKEMELAISNMIKRKVIVKGNSEQHGTISVEFYDNSELRDISDALIEFFEKYNEENE